MLLPLLTLFVIGAQDSTLIGFHPDRVMTQRELEERFLATPSSETAERNLGLLTAEPHVAGTAADRRVVDFLAAELKRLGMDRVEIPEYHVWLSYPKDVSLTIVAPNRVRLENREAFYAEDPSGDPRRIMPGWNAYAANGTVTADVVYVNYGLPEDYEQLARLGIDVEGKIALARFGRSHRAIKALAAGERGMIGVIIYSDPADDGYGQGDVYPNGPYRSADAIQRGTLMYEAQYVGDPLTPGRAAIEGVERLRPAEAKNVPKLPMIPIGYGNAQRILEQLEGPSVPQGWQGGLPFAYRAGPGPVVVELAVDLDYQVRPIWNVIGTMRGAEFPDEWIILGNHHDAWTYGAVDPNSGTTALLEVARGLQALRETGWRPRRTIKLAFWGAEEYGQIGSTEWVEHHRDELREKALTYINLDAFTAGPFAAAGSPSLRDLVVGVLRDVADPAGGTLFEGTRRLQHEAWVNRWQGRPAADREPFAVELGDLGAGSDFQAFLEHAAIPTLDITMEGAYGVYHAMQDNFFFFSKFGDPGFRYTPVMAGAAGLLVLRLSQADVVPLRYGHYARRVTQYLEDLEHINLGDEGYPRIAVDLRDARRALDALQVAADALDRRLAAMARTGAPAASANQALPAVERAFTDDPGLPGRPWFKHLIYAPAYYNGYAALPLPGPHQALLDRDAIAFERELARVVRVIERAQRAMEDIGRPAGSDEEVQS